MRHSAVSLYFSSCAALNNVCVSACASEVTLMMIIALRRRATSICLRLNCSFSPACLPSSHRSRAQIKTQRGLFAPFVTCACLFTAAFVLQLFQSPSRTASFSSASHLCMFLLSYNLYYANLDAHHSFPRDLLHSIRFSHKTCRSCCSALVLLNVYI